jgi:hypothetical protein
MPTPNEYVQRCNRINDELGKHRADGKPITTHLVAAGDAAADVLKELLEDKAFWTHLSSKKAPDDKSPDPYAPVVTQYHAAVLTALGYKPPPPAQEVAQGVADLLVAKRGSDAKELEEVRRSIASLKDRLVTLSQEARTS